MNVELIDDVADGGDVDFVDVKRVFDPGRELSGVDTDLFKLFSGQFMKFSDCRFGDEKQPDEVRVVFQQHTASAEAA